MHNQPKTNWRTFATLAAICLTSASCSSLTKQVARDATPEVIDSGIEAGLSDENQEAVVRAIEPERIERGTTKVAGGMTDGLTTALGDEERQARIAEALAPVFISLVDSSMRAALDDEHLGRVRELAKQATLGFQDAIDEVAELREQGKIPSDEGNVLETADQIAEGAGSTLYALGGLAALLALALLAGFIWALRRKRGYEKEVARRDEQLDELMRRLPSDPEATASLSPSSETRLPVRDTRPAERPSASPS